MLSATVSEKPTTSSWAMSLRLATADESVLDGAARATPATNDNTGSFAIAIMAAAGQSPVFNVVGGGRGCQKRTPPDPERQIPLAMAEAARFLYAAVKVWRPHLRVSQVAAWGPCSRIHVYGK